MPIVKKESYSFPKILTKSPDQGSSSVLFSTGTTYDEKNEELYGLVRFRPTSHDYLMPSIGRPPNSQLTVFDLEIQFYKTNFKVCFFDLINIQNLNNSETGLPGDGVIAWSIRMGYGPDQLACFSCNSYFTRGSLGYSFGNNSNTILPYTMIGGQVQSRSKYGSYIHSHLYARILVNSNEYFALREEWGYKYYLEKDRKYNSFAST